MNMQEPIMNRKHLVCFQADGKLAMLELCVFCKRKTDMDRIGECEHFVEKYIGSVCSEFVKADDISSRLNEALNARTERRRNE